MSHAHGQALFADGTVLYFEYNGTADVPCSALRLTEAEVDAHWRDDNDAECTCGQSSEPCQLSVAIGPEPWQGTACRRCMAITGGFFPYGNDEDDAETLGWASTGFSAPKTAFQAPLSSSFDVGDFYHFSDQRGQSGGVFVASDDPGSPAASPRFREFSGDFG